MHLISDNYKKVLCTKNGTLDFMLWPMQSPTLFWIIGDIFEFTWFYLVPASRGKFFMILLLLFLFFLFRLPSGKVGFTLVVGAYDANRFCILDRFCAIGLLFRLAVVRRTNSHFVSKLHNFWKLRTNIFLEK